jgi:hypothetical protein
MKKVLKLKIHTAKGYFQLGKHKVGKIAAEYDLSKEEVKELSGKGPSHYLVEAELPKKRVKKVIKKEEK